MLKSTPKTFTATRPTHPAENSGIFSDGTKGQKLDPQPHPQNALLKQSVEGNSRKRPNPQRVTVNG